jgi:hypothetical protein
MGPTIAEVRAAPNADIPRAQGERFTLRLQWDFGTGEATQHVPAAQVAGVLLQPSAPVLGVGTGMRFDLGRWHESGLYVPLFGAYLLYAGANDTTRVLRNGATLESGSATFAGGHIALPGIGERWRLGRDAWGEIALFPSLSLAGYGVTEISPGTGTFHDVHTTQQLTAIAPSASLDMSFALCSDADFLGACVRLDPIVVSVPVHGLPVPLDGVRAFISFVMQ